MIISASRRTDIPAFYADWFIKRVKAGFCEVANPFNPAQISRVSLLPEDVDGIVFWTRNPGPLIPLLSELDSREIAYYFLITLLDYPSRIEPGLPSLAVRLEAFKRLAGQIGPKRVIWRYDPIAAGPGLDVSFHLKTQARLASELRGNTRKCLVSFLEPYRKIAKRLKELAGDGHALARPDDSDKIELISGLKENCAACGLSLYGCASPAEVVKLGLEPNACVDAGLLSEISGRTIAQAKDPGQRPDCQCTPSRDIGAYDTCGHGCAYCYATASQARARANYARHDPESPLLLPEANSTKKSSAKAGGLKPAD